jgi:hypothetical protein
VSKKLAAIISQNAKASPEITRAAHAARRSAAPRTATTA